VEQKEASVFRHSVWLFLLLLPCGFAASQSVPPHTTSMHGDDVFGGYVFGSGDSNQSGGGLLAGFDVNDLYKRLGLTVEFDWTKASSPPSPVNATSEFNVLAGPRFTFAETSKVSPFADVLVGTETFHNGGQLYTYRFNSGTSLAWSVDGGVDVKLSKRFALRGQAGYLGTSLGNSLDGNPGNGGSTFAGRVRVGGTAVFRF
jgi:hypothetical protein